LFLQTSRSSHADLMVMSSIGQCGRFSGEPGFAASSAGTAAASVSVGACYIEALLFPLVDGLISSVGSC
jgi:hypothetical protein